MKPGLILIQEAEKSTYLNELDAKKHSGVSISDRSEEQTLGNLLQNLKISNPCFKAVYSYVHLMTEQFVVRV